MAAAALMRAGIPAISQRDDRSLHLLCDLLVGTRSEVPTERDHWGKEWQGYFKD